MPKFGFELASQTPVVISVYESKGKKKMLQGFMDKVRIAEDTIP